ncbi:MAG: histidinol-phosphate transaminase [Acidimicrobiia bacterium]
MTRRPNRRDDLAGLTGYHSPQLDVAVRLNTNESPFPPPEGFVAAWRDALATMPLHRYPDRDARDLRTVIATMTASTPEQVMVANGSNEVLQTVFLAYGGAGRRALVAEPTYALHRHIAQITGTEVVEIARNDDFTVDADRMIDAIREHQPAIVFLCNPNNPTGTIEAVATVRAVADACDAEGAVLIVDEAYAEFLQDSSASALALVAEDRNVVVSRTFSKVWSLASLRLGFAIGPTWFVGDCETVSLPYRLSIATQLAGIYAPRFGAEMQSRIDLIVHEREVLVERLAAFPALTAFPSGANFVLVRVPGAARAVWEGLVSHGVLVRDFSSWPGLTDCLRVTIGTEAENDAFVRALERVLADKHLGA